MAVARRYINRAKVLEEVGTVFNWARAPMASDDPKGEVKRFIDELEEALHTILEDDAEEAEEEEETEDE